MPGFIEFRPSLGTPEGGLLHLELIGPAPKELRTQRVFGGDLVAVTAQHPDWDRCGVPALSVVMAFAGTLGELADGYIDRATAQEWVTDNVHAAAALLIQQQLN